MASLARIRKAVGFAGRAGRKLKVLLTSGLSALGCHGWMLDVNVV